MRIAHLGLTDYRSYEAVEVDFAAGVNLLVGANGQGKTNVVEAVAYLATLTSHRVANDTALVVVQRYWWDQVVRPLASLMPRSPGTK